MKTNKNAAYGILALLAVLTAAPGASAALQDVTIDFESDAAGADPQHPYFTFSETTGGTLVTAVQASGGQDGGQYYLHDEGASGQQSASRFDWTVDLCSVDTLEFWFNSPNTGTTANGLGYFFHDKDQFTTRGQAAGYDGFGIRIINNVVAAIANGDGTATSLDIGAVSANTWYKATISAIDCAGASATIAVDGVGSQNVNDGGSIADLDRLSLTSYTATSAQYDYRLDDIVLGGVDAPLDPNDVLLFPEPVDGLKVSNDASPTVYIYDRDSVVRRYDAQDFDFETLLGSTNVCTPQSSQPNTIDPAFITAFDITSTDEVMSVCQDAGVVGFPFHQFHDETLVTDLAHSATHDFQPIAVAGSKNSDGERASMLASADGQTVLVYADPNGDDILTLAATESCPTASVADVATSRENDPDTSMFLVTDSCGVIAYSTFPVAELFTAPSAIGTSITSHSDIVYVSDSIGNTLKRYIAGGGTLTSTHTVAADHGNVQVSWDGRYVMAWKGSDAWLFDGSNLTLLADFTFDAAFTVIECDIDASNNYAYCGGEDGAGAGATGWAATLEIFPFTVSEVGDGNATTPNPVIGAGQFDPPIPGTGGGVGIGTGNPGTITPSEPKGLLGLDVVAIGDDAIGDGNLFAIIVALAVMTGLAAAGAAGGHQVGVALWGGVAGGVVGLIGTTLMGWMPLWVILFIVLIAAAIVVYRWTGGAE